ncbi:MAG: plastocyanin/azurin family copper-binding protein [Thermoleophilia bacterium]
MKIRMIHHKGLPLAMVLAVAAVLTLAACGGSSGGSTGGGAPATTPAGSGGDTVAIADFAFSPQTLVVKAGTTVTWINEDGSPHTVTSTEGPGTGASTTDLFDSGSLAQGETFAFRFDAAGTYYYECTLHASTAAMHAEVVVQ